jgi:flagella basal body P-ring formation protein FlgA
MATSRLGSQVDVEVAVTDVRMIDAEGTITALPDQGARIGIPSRFTLFADRRRLRLGEATAVVSAVGGAVRLRRTLARSEIVGQDDVEVVRAPMDGARFAPAPTLETVVGARASHDMGAGTLFTPADYLPQPLVKPGETVRAIVRVSRVLEITGRAVALQAGDRHEVISVMNPETRQTRRGRVVAPGEVEMIDVR